MVRDNKRCIVMVVDDERLMEEYIAELLRGQGYEYASFNDPGQAIAFFSANAESVGLIISDIRMPSIDGLELARRAVEIKPDISIILLSGYSEKLPQASVMPNVQAVFEKPLLKTDLMQAVASVMNKCRSQGSSTH